MDILSVTVRPSVTLAVTVCVPIGKLSISHLLPYCNKNSENLRPQGYLLAGEKWSFLASTAIC